MVQIQGGHNITPLMYMNTTTTSIQSRSRSKKKEVSVYAAHPINLGCQFAASLTNPTITIGPQYYIYDVVSKDT
jgi:hypothetical protein